MTGPQALTLTAVLLWLPAVLWPCWLWLPTIAVLYFGWAVEILEAER